MERLAFLVTEAQNPVIVPADFNMTPWSQIFREFLVRTRLRDARKGFGVTATSQTQAPSQLIPIDHCPMSRDIGDANFFTGSHIGSDHYSVMVEVGFLDALHGQASEVSATLRGNPIKHVA